jgi:hypothetical protein
MTTALPAPIYMPVPNQHPGQLDAYYSINFGQDPTFTLNTTGSFNGYNIKALTLHVYNPSNSPVNVAIGGGILYAPQNTDNYYDITGVLSITFTCQQGVQISIDLLNYKIPAGSQAITNLSQSRDQYFSQVIGLYHFIGPSGTTGYNQVQSVVDNAIGGYGIINETMNTGYFITDPNLYLFPPTSLKIANGATAYGTSNATQTMSVNTTVEFAINYQAFPSLGYYTILQMGGTESLLQHRYTANGLIYVWAPWGGGNTLFNSTAISNPQLNTWYYVAFTFIDLTALQFINGTFVQSATNYAQPSFTAQNLIIGDSLNYFGTFHLAELRITNAPRYLTNYQVQSYPFPNNF